MKQTEIKNSSQKKEVGRIKQGLNKGEWWSCPELFYLNKKFPVQTPL